MINKKNSIEEINKYGELLDKYSFVLSKTQEQIMKLYYYENLSIKEISEIVATTRSAVFDALKKGRLKLDKFENIN